MSNFVRLSPVDSRDGSYGSGFFSNYRITLESLINNDKRTDGVIPYVDWGDTIWVEGYNPYVSNILIKKENPFDFWFDQIIPRNDDIVFEENLFYRFRIINHGIDYSELEYKNELNHQRFIDSKYLKPKQFLIDKIDEIYNTEFDGNVVLGVMARGCEFNYHHQIYGNHTIKDYIDIIKEILINHPEITKLFLVSEDLNYINILKENFPSSYFMPDVFRRTNETIDYMNTNPLWPNIDTKRENQNMLLGSEVIIQTKLLGKCDYLIGKHTGIFCGAILWGEKIKKIYKI